MAKKKLPPVDPLRKMIDQGVREWDGIRRRFLHGWDRLVDKHGASYRGPEIDKLFEDEERDRQGWYKQWDPYLGEIIKEMNDARRNAPKWLGPSPALDHERGKFYGSKVSPGQGQAKTPVRGRRSPRRA